MTGICKVVLKETVEENGYKLGHTRNTLYSKI